MSTEPGTSAAAEESTEAVVDEPRDVASLVLRARRGPRLKYVFFWGHREPLTGVDSACMSQWYPSPFTVDDVTYPTAEHWMMAGKARMFGDADAERRVLAAGHPKTAKTIGRQVRGFDEQRWVAARFELIVRGNVAKFGQHEAMRAFLLGTGRRVLVEASPLDRIWGIGLAADDERAGDPERWRGLNLLGFALMEARSRLANATDRPG
ncbi:NADAR family protein [Embleya sp. NBC_00896]|uniref:NADAR family protein n=1 Tax=Embleya sp. NBC_00896 TaxID=2975961 RepID=UPI0038682192|nr:NADAR family protein [Embleya sp. NBC_00896]